MEYVSIAQSRAGSPGEISTAFPNGEPEVGWKAAELVAYAAANGFDVSNAKTKQEKVDAIKAEKSDQPVNPGPPLDSVESDESAGAPHTSVDPTANINPNGGESAQKPEEG